MGPEWTAFYALFASEAASPLTREEVLFVPLPSREETRPLVAAVLALTKHGLPTPPGPMYEHWIPVNRVVKSLQYAAAHAIHIPITALTVLTVALGARNYRLNKPLFQVFEVDHTWWVRAHPQTPPLTTIGPAGEVIIGMRSRVKGGRLSLPARPRTPTRPPLRSPTLALADEPENPADSAEGA